MDKLEAVLFDLDGTLLDTAADLAAACNYTLERFGLKALPEKLIRTRVTSGMRAMLSLGIRDSEKSHYDLEGAMRTCFADYYSAHIADLTKPFPYIEAFCEKASSQGLKLAVITSKYEDMALSVLAKFPLNNTLSLILGCDSTPYSKPDPRPILTALERLSIKPQNAVYIGDHLNDIKAANAAGVTSIAALWGYGESECGSAEDWQAKRLMKSPEELFSLLD